MSDDTERRLADGVLGLSRSEEEPGGSADTNERVTQMQETVAALRQWRESIDAEPLPQVPVRARIARMPILVAAAAVFAVVVGLFLAQRASPTGLADELDWVASTSDEEPAPGMTVRYVVREPAHADRRYPARPLTRRPDKTDVIAGFTFAFRLPDTVAGDMRLLWVDKHGNDRARLIYGAGERRLAVFLAKSAGADVAVSRVCIDGKTVMAGRRAGVAAAFEVTGENGYDWRAVFEQFMERQHEEGDAS